MNPTITDVRDTGGGTPLMSWIKKCSVTVLTLLAFMFTSQTDLSAQCGWLTPPSDTTVVTYALSSGTLTVSNTDLAGHPSFNPSGIVGGTTCSIYLIDTSGGGLILNSFTLNLECGMDTVVQIVSSDGIGAAPGAVSPILAVNFMGIDNEPPTMDTVSLAAHSLFTDIIRCDSIIETVEKLTDTLMAYAADACALDTAMYLLDTVSNNPCMAIDDLLIKAWAVDMSGNISDTVYLTLNFEDTMKPYLDTAGTTVIFASWTPGTNYTDPNDYLRTGDYDKAVDCGDASALATIYTAADTAAIRAMFRDSACSDIMTLEVGLYEPATTPSPDTCATYGPFDKVKKVTGFYWTAIDSCNNTSADTVFTYIFTIDTIAPEIMLGIGDGVSEDTVVLYDDGNGACEATWTFDMYPRAAGDTLITDQCHSFAGIHAWSSVMDPAAASKEDSLLISVTVALADSLVTIYSEDDCGNIDSFKVRVIVLDTFPPVITDCPSDITLYTSAMSCNVLGTWDAPVARDSCYPDGVTLATAGTPGVVAAGTTTAIGPDGNPVNVTNVGGQSLAILDLGVTSLKYIFEDHAADSTTLAINSAPNKDSCEMKITVLDTMAPDAKCQNLTVYLDETGSITVYATDVDYLSTDNCFIDSIFVNGQDSVLYTCDSVGARMIEFVAVDSSGNADTCMATMTVVDSIAPVMSCNTVEVSLGATGTATSLNQNDLLGTLYDNCGTVTLTPVTFDPACANLGTNTVTMVATDDAGNTDSCVATIIVKDTIAPTIVAGSGLTGLSATAATCTATPTWTAAAATDNCTADSDIVITSSHASGNALPVGTTTVTVTATDASGNVATTTFDVTVTNDVLPTMALIANQTLNTSEVTGCDMPDFTGLAIAQHPCNASFGITQTPAISSDISASMNTNGTFNVTLTVTGTGVTQPFTVTVTDNTPLVMTACPADMVVSCGAIPSWTAPIFTDDCGVQVDSSVTGVPAAWTAGTHVITYSATEDGHTASCNFTITVEDAVAPVIGAIIDMTVNADQGMCSAAVTLPTATAADACGTVASIVSSHNSGDVFAVGVTTVTVTATDNTGNVSTLQYDVTVLDAQAPVAICDDTNVYLDANGFAVIDSSTINGGSNDNCGIFSYAFSTDSLDCTDLGNATVTMTVTDVAGNTATCTSLVEVVDTIAPVAACMTNMDISLDSTGNVSIDAEDLNNGSTDNTYPLCDLTYSIPTDAGAYTCANLGDTIEIELTVTDVAGNSDVCTGSVIITDAIAPYMDADRATELNVALEPQTCDTTYTLYMPAIMDNCAGEMLTLVIDGVSMDVTDSTEYSHTFPGGVTNCSYVTMDSAGNSTTYNFVVDVIDAIDPVLTECQAQIIGYDTLNIEVITEDFESASLTGWTFSQSEGDDPGFVQSTLREHSGSYSYYHNDDNIASTSTSWMISPAIAVSLNTNSLSFWYNQDYTPAYYEYSGVWISTTGTAEGDFVELAELTDGEDNWLNYVASLDAYIGDTIYIAFKYEGDYSHEFYIDDFSVGGELYIPIFAPSQLDTTLYTSTMTPGDCDALYEWNHFTFSDNCPDATMSVIYQYADGTSAGPIDVTADTGVATSQSFAPGENIVTYTVTDAYGNETACGFTITVVDDEPATFNAAAFTTCFYGSPSTLPAQELSSPACGDTVKLLNIPNACLNNFSWVRPSLDGIEDNCSNPVTGITLIEQFSDAAVAGSIEAGYPFNQNIPCDHPTLKNPETDFPVGVTEIAYIIIDSSGFAATGTILYDTCSFFVEVQDNQDPVINCPPAQTLSYACNGAMVPDFTGLPGLIVTDNCPGAVVTQSPAAGLYVDSVITNAQSGSVFTVTLTATDSYGNTGTCNFTVTLDNTTNPMPTVLSYGAFLDPITPLTNIDAYCGNLLIDAPTAIDCGTGDTIYGVPSSSSIVPNTPNPNGSGYVDYTFTETNGQYTVVWTYSDASGNTSVQYQYIELSTDPMYNRAPRVACVGTDMIVDVDAGACGYTNTMSMAMTDVSAMFANLNDYDNTILAAGTYAATCGTPTIEFEVSGAMTAARQLGNDASVAITTFPVGATTVTYYVTDTDSEETSCSFTITVEDNEAPQIACPQGDGSGVLMNATFAGGVLPAGWSVDSYTDFYKYGTAPFSFEGTDGSGLFTYVDNASFSGSIATVSYNETTAPDAPMSIVTNVFDGTNASSFAFDWIYGAYSTSYSEAFYVEVYDGTDWNIIFHTDSSSNGGPYNGNYAEYAGNDTLDVSAYSNAAMQLRFVYYPGTYASGNYVTYGYGFGIDNINVMTPSNTSIMTEGFDNATIPTNWTTTPDATTLITEGLPTIAGCSGNSISSMFSFDCSTGPNAASTDYSGNVARISGTSGNMSGSGSITTAGVDATGSTSLKLIFDYGARHYYSYNTSFVVEALDVNGNWNEVFNETPTTGYNIQTGGNKEIDLPIADYAHAGVQARFTYFENGYTSTSTQYTVGLDNIQFKAEGLENVAFDAAAPEAEQANNVAFVVNQDQSFYYTVENTAGLCTGEFSWYVPGVIENCSGFAYDVTYLNADGTTSTEAVTMGDLMTSTLPGGVNTIELNVTDNSGNIATCSFDVHVSDIENPIFVTCNSNINIGDVVESNSFDIFPGTGWAETDGYLTQNSTLSTAASNWTADGFANNGNTGAARMNIFSTFPKEWLISPVIDLGTGGAVMTLDAAFTDYANSNIADGVGADDWFAIVVSPDSGTTWSTDHIVKEWKGGTVADWPSHTGEKVTIALPYSGKVKIGFYTESTVSNADNDLHIDNISISPMEETGPAILANTSSNGYGDCTGAYTWTVPEVTDNCDVIDVLVTIDGVTDTVAPGSTITKEFGVGSYVIEQTAIDGSGNTADCHMAIEVADDEAPVAICDEINVNLAENGMVTISQEIIENNINDGSYDNCGDIDTMYLSTNTFDCDDLGDNTVLLYVVDKGGNTAACMTTVNVQSNPIPNWAADITVSCGSDLTPATTGMTGTGSACANSVVAYVDAIVGNEASGCYSIERTWTITNNDITPALVLTNVQVITVSDDIDPVFEAFASPVNVTCALTIPEATATDNCDTDVKITYLDVSNQSTNPDDCAYYSYTLTRNWIATDSCGNTTSMEQVFNVSDTQAPFFVGVISEMDINLSSNGNGGALCRAMVDLDLTSNVADCATNLTLTTMLPDGSVITGFDATGEYSVGANVFVFTATDPCGNTNTQTVTVNIVDNVGPTVICDDDLTLILNSAGFGTLQAEDVDEGSHDACGGLDTMYLSKNFFNCADIGLQTVVLTVVDVNGNENTCTSVITVKEEVAPVITCQSITIGAGETFTPSQLVATASDNCTDFANLTFSTSVTSFGCADLGVQQVEVMVTDASGNTTSCFAEVTVTSTGSLTAVCQPVAVTLNANGVASVTAADLDGGSLGCIATMSVSQTTFDCSNLGTNTVTFTVSDALGNDNSCTAIVTVSDDSDPMAMAQNATIALDANGMATVTTAMVDNGSYDNCSIATMSLSQTAFTCADLGDNTVTLTVVDAAGNTSTSTSTILVTDDTAPMASCQDVTVSMTAGMASITAAMVDNGSADNCAVTSVAVAPMTFTTAGMHTVTLTVMDAAGNTSICTSTVTVESNGVTFTAGDVVATGATAIIPVTVTGFENITNFQFSAHLVDASIGTITGISSTNGVAGNVVYSDVATISFFDMTGNGLTLMDGDVVFNIEVDLNGSAGCNTANSVIALDGNPTMITAANTSGIISVTLEDGSISSTGGDTQLAGNVMKTLNNTPVENVMIDVTTTAGTSTDVNGDYSLCVDAGNNYTVTPSYAGDLTEYVDITDLIMIQQHILFIDTFNNYQRIAADASNDGIITTYDIVLLQQALLGNITAFPNNTSWRFIASNHGPLFASAPAQQDAPSNYPESRSYNPITMDVMDANFLAVKIGDVEGQGVISPLNGVGTTQATTTENSARTDGTLYFAMEDTKVEAGEEYNVVMTAKDFQGMLGYQFTLDFDADVLEYVGNEANAVEANFGLNFLAEGAITTVWSAAKAVSVDNNEAMFTLTFVANRDADKLADLFSVSDRYTGVKAQRADGTVMDVAISYGETTAAIVATKDFTLFQNYPNPFRSVTTVSVSLPVAAEGVLNIYDMNGRLVRSYTENCTQGVNEFTINRGDLATASSVLYYEFTTEGFTATKQMILVD